MTWQGGRRTYERYLARGGEQSVPDRQGLPGRQQAYRTCVHNSSLTAIGKKHENAPERHRNLSGVQLGRTPQLEPRGQLNWHPRRSRVSISLCTKAEIL